jgi:hypothetical protein
MDTDFIIGLAAVCLSVWFASASIVVAIRYSSRIFIWRSIGYLLLGIGGFLYMMQPFNNIVAIFLMFSLLFISFSGKRFHGEMERHNIRLSDMLLFRKRRSDE